jgi:hypothetical protein
MMGERGPSRGPIGLRESTALHPICAPGSAIRTDGGNSSSTGTHVPTNSFRKPAEPNAVFELDMGHVKTNLETLGRPDGKGQNREVRANDTRESVQVRTCEGNRKSKE